MLFSRLALGLLLLAWLAPQYLAAMWLGRAWRRAGLAWRRAIDRQGSRLLVAYIRRHGGLLIKVGQFIATRPDAFPLAYVDACAPLRDQAPARPFSIMRPVLDAAWEGRIEDHLARIEETPLASASFGQVHRAWLADGRLVAVKIQYPDLGPAVAADLFLIRLSLRLFAFVLPGWPLHILHDEIARTAQAEQDYLQEGLAADRLRAPLATFGIRVPEVLWEHSRERVLVMEFAAGATLAATDIGSLPAAERERLAGMLIDGFLHMLIEVGFFHADPHAGNLLYQPGADGGPGTLWLIDYGMTCTLSRQEAEGYRRFLACLQAHDTDGMVDVLLTLGWTLPGQDRSRMKALAREVYESLARLDPQTFKDSRMQLELANRIGEFLRRVEGLVFPAHTILLSRATGLVEGICMRLVPGRNLLDLIRPRLRRILSPLRLVKQWFERLGEGWRELRALPDRLEAAVARRAQGVSPRLLVAATALVVAALLEPGTPRLVAGTAAGLALLFSLRD